MPFEWHKVGTRFSILWLFKFPSGALPPPDEQEVKGKSFLEVTDIGVRRIHAEDGGLGIPNSFLVWHWAMVLVYGLLFSLVFLATTPLGDEGAGFPWLTLVHKLVVFFSLWESLGLGVIHGPLHAKMSPPFTDWWYRLTPGTMKYNAPFMPSWLPMKRNCLDVLIEGVVMYLFLIRALCAPEVVPSLMLPIALCSLYEFLFDYGQHLHNYGTQNLHVFVCCCFPVDQGQVVGIQLFLTWFYFCSGFCKLGPTFKHFFTCNLMTAKYMVRVPWAAWFRKTFFTAHDAGDYTLRPPAGRLATAAALIEMLVPLLTWINDPVPVWISIATFLCMHAFIISTLVIDVFAWNFTDACWYTVLYGILRTGIDWAALPSMHPWLKAWLIAHALYSAYGHFVPDHVPYVVAHRHAAGNWSQGVLVVRKAAAAKLSKLRAHAGLPGQQPGWAGEWFAFHGFWAYTWNWNVPNRLLVPLVVDAMGTGAPSDGMFHSTGDYILLHSVLFFDSLVAHLRFDGVSNLALVAELGRVCGFEEGECRLCWVGAFPSFLTGNPRASWKLVDAATGVQKEGSVTAAELLDRNYRKPSECGKLLDLVRAVGAAKGREACTSADALLPKR